MSPFETAKKVVIGNVAHDAVDSGNPIKFGGKASATPPTAVSSGDRVDTWFDAQGRLIIGTETNPTVTMSASTPVPAGSDVTALSGAALVSGDFSIRDTNYHYFVRPTAGRTVQAIFFRIQTVFDQIATVEVFGQITNEDVVAVLQPAFTIGASTAALVGFSNLPPVPGTPIGSGNDPAVFSMFYIPGLASFPFISLRVSFPSNPSVGTFNWLQFHRSAS